MKVVSYFPILWLLFYIYSTCASILSTRKSSPVSAIYCYLNGMRSFFSVTYCLFVIGKELLYNSVGSAIHWHESPIGIHVPSLMHLHLPPLCYYRALGLSSLCHTLLCNFHALFYWALPDFQIQDRFVLLFPYPTPQLWNQLFLQGYQVTFHRQY